MTPKGFRVTVKDLSNEDAITAMHFAAHALVSAALGQRVTLLRLGFAEDHQLCQALDKTAEEYTVVIEVLRRQEARRASSKNRSDRSQAGV